MLFSIFNNNLIILHFVPKMGNKIGTFQNKTFFYTLNKVLRSAFGGNMAECCLVVTNVKLESEPQVLAHR